MEKRKKNKKEGKKERRKNNAGYTDYLVACGWAGAVMEVTGTYRQKQ